MARLASGRYSQRYSLDGSSDKAVATVATCFIVRKKIVTCRCAALQLHVNISFNRPPDRTWRRPPGRPRNKWLDQLRHDSTRPIGELWRRAVDHGHDGATMRRPSPATRPWRWWWWWWCHDDVTSASSLSVFKNRLKTYLFRRCYETVWLWMTFPFRSHYLPSRTVVLTIVFTV